MTTITITPVVLAGGSGTRLWPLSRELFPKQLLPIAGETSMLQDTVLRLDGLHLQPPIVICNAEHRFLVAQQLREIGFGEATILLEPAGRNTAPAVAVAALEAQRRGSEGNGGDESVLLVLCADHVIADEAGFREAVRQGAALATARHLITFGVVPASPETGYGYIRRSENVLSGIGFAVASFVEKPDQDTAQRYIDAGDYYWNSGMFMFTSAEYLAELGKFVPDMIACCQQSHEGARREHDFVWLEADSFDRCPSDSIDYAVMEHTRNAAVIPIDVGWNDVGSWAALAELCERDAEGNVKIGDVLSHDTRHSYLRADHRLLATVGLTDTIVVETADAVLVARADRVQDVKAIVAELKAKERGEVAAHRRVYRPWGSYESIDAAPGWQVKCIRVTPGASLSLQMHHHRAEHWVVVKGEAEVTRGDEVFRLKENESTFIPVGTRHRLHNPGPGELEMIEVQSGDYLGEDDIVRFDDVYGRAAPETGHQG